MTKHLWEIDHPYYFDGSHYFGTGSSCAGELFPRFDTFQSFLSEWDSADADYNLVWRWDWTEDAPPPNGDQHYRNGTLLVNFMMQRKGYHLQARVSVCRADEPGVIEYLRSKADHIRLLWGPLLDVGGSVDGTEP